MNREIAEQVKLSYGSVAASGLSTNRDDVKAVAEAFGYSTAELAAIPAEANLGLSCGNPLALASLRAGEVVVDLGCGGGLDVLLAAQRVGVSGKAIGIDMTPEMIELARANAARLRAAKRDDQLGAIEFHLAPIHELPLDSNSVDCVISNCVINLVEDKPSVFREILRVLKPGGRLAVSDIALKRPLPQALADDIAAYVGCIGGAILMSEYRQQLENAGFSAVEVIDSGVDLNAYAQIADQAGCCSPAASSSSQLPVTDPVGRGPEMAAGQDAFHRRLAELLARYNVNDYAASVKVLAVKSAS